MSDGDIGNITGTIVSAGVSLLFLREANNLLNPRQRYVPRRIKHRRRKGGIFA